MFPLSFSPSGINQDQRTLHHLCTELHVVFLESVDCVNWQQFFFFIYYCRTFVVVLCCLRAQRSCTFKVSVLCLYIVRCPCIPWVLFIESFCSFSLFSLSQCFTFSQHMIISHWIVVTLTWWFITTSVENVVLFCFHHSDFNKNKTSQLNTIVLRNKNWGLTCPYLNLFDSVIPCNPLWLNVMVFGNDWLTPFRNSGCGCRLPIALCCPLTCLFYIWKQPEHRRCVALGNDAFRQLCFVSGILDWLIKMQVGVLWSIMPWL